MIPQSSWNQYNSIFIDIKMSAKFESEISNYRNQMKSRNLIVLMINPIFVINRTIITYRDIIISLLLTNQ